MTKLVLLLHGLKSQAIATSFYVVAFTAEMDMFGGTRKYPTRKAATRLAERERANYPHVFVVQCDENFEINEQSNLPMHYGRHIVDAWVVHPSDASRAILRKLRAVINRWRFDEEDAYFG